MSIDHSLHSCFSSLRMRPISVKTGVVIVALTLCVASVAVADRQTAKAMLPKIYASETTAYMYDTSGRQRIFHGGNFVQKGFPVRQAGEARAAAV